MFSGLARLWSGARAARIGWRWLVCCVALAIVSLNAGSAIIVASPPALPFCALSAESQQQLDRLWGQAALAVVDLRSRETWAGGNQRHLFTLHSTTKAALAFAVLTKLEQERQATTAWIEARLPRMVVHGENEATDELFDWLGGPAALAEFYQRINAQPLADGVHGESWGLGRARIADIARMFARLARSAAIPEQARASAVGMLAQTPAALHWRAYSVYALPEWTAAAKSGWFWLEDDSQRINLVALLLDDSGRLRYALVLMYEGVELFEDVWARFNAAIGWLAHDLSLRERERPYGDRGCAQVALFLRQLSAFLGPVP